MDRIRYRLIRESRPCMKPAKTCRQDIKKPRKRVWPCTLFAADFAIEIEKTRLSLAHTVGHEFLFFLELQIGIIFQEKREVLSRFAPIGMCRKNLCGWNDLCLQLLQAVKKHVRIGALSKAHPASFNEKRVSGEKIILNQIADAAHGVPRGKHGGNPDLRSMKGCFRCNCPEVVAMEQE